jgi:hypothetical protein
LKGKERKIIINFYSRTFAFIPSIVAIKADIAV